MREVLNVESLTYSKIHTKKAEASQLAFKMLDDLSQVYKTPLTVILAASEGLSEMGRLSATQSELFSVHSFGSAISAENCEFISWRHGGRVWVTSSEAEGTAFYASIPFSKRERGSL